MKREKCNVVTAIVTAGGRQDRWAGPGPKQLVQVLGQPMLQRTVEQLRGFCDTIHILAWRPEILALFPDASMPDIKYQEYLLPVLRATADRWTGDRTIFVHGDVAFGSDTLRILTESKAGVMFIGTHVEVFAVTFSKAYKPKMRQSLDAAIAYGFSVNPFQHGNLKLWSLYRHCAGLNPAVHDPGTSRIFRHVTDWTSDVDTEGRYHLLQDKIKAAREAGTL